MSKERTEKYMMRQKSSLWSLLLLLFVSLEVEAFNFASLLYALNICSGPSNFCPEPNCLHDHKDHLCKWYDCGTSSGRFLKEDTGRCTFIGSVEACGGDKRCIDACKELNRGSCPQCYGNCYDGDYSQDYYNTNVGTGSQGSDWQPPDYNRDWTVYVIVALIVGVVAWWAASNVGKRVGSSLGEHLNPGGEGLVKERMEAVEAGTAEEIKVIEDKTGFAATGAGGRMAYAVC